MATKKGWQPDEIDSLKGETHIITGATSGTGFQATRLLLSKGANVVMLNRNEVKTATTLSKLRAEFGDAAPVSGVKMD